MEPAQSFNSKYTSCHRNFGGRTKEGNHSDDHKKGVIFCSHQVKSDKGFRTKGTEDGSECEGGKKDAARDSRCVGYHHENSADDEYDQEQIPEGIAFQEMLTQQMVDQRVPRSEQFCQEKSGKSGEGKDDGELDSDGKLG